MNEAPASVSPVLLSWTSPRSSSTIPKESPRPFAAGGLRLLLLVALLALFGAGQTQDAARESTSAVADLPVTKVVLFTSGVGYFEHSGTVTGNAELLLDFADEEMDDMLQSLVLQDFGGGTVSPVRYASRDPLGRILSTYSLDLSDDPTLAELVSNARGQLVDLETSEHLRGRVVNVERVAVPESEPVTYLTLATDSGLRRIDMNEVRTISFVSRELQAELDEALAAIARYRGHDDQPVTLRFEGEGERQVSVGYVREMPVWKTSYRLLLGEDGEADLQGWAIFDNPTDMDLENVSVAFKAGRPISFVSTLFEPVYLTRQRIAAATTPEVTARAFEADSFAERQEPAFDVAAASRLAAPVAAPQLSGAGVSAMAQGTATGATFEYRVEVPVTVGRHESAMIPIVSTTVEDHRLSIFDAKSHPVHPLRGVRLQNSTGLHLSAGPVSIFDQGGFAGNALISDIVPGDSRVLAYAVDLDLQVTSDSTSQPEELFAVAINNGVVETSQRQRVVTRYQIEMRGSEARFLVIEHPRRQEFEVVSPATRPATTAASYRFGVAIEGADSTAVTPDPTVPIHLLCEREGSCELSVALEREVSRSLAITNLSSEQILFYLENVELADEDRQLFSQVLELKRRLADLDSRIASSQERVDAVFRDQGRIRQNMAQLDRNSSLYRRYLAELEAQENELGALSQSIEELNQERQETQEQLDELIGSL